MLGSSCCALGLGCLSCLAVGAQLCMLILGHCPHLWLWLWGEVKQTGVSSQWPCDLPHLGVCSQPSSWSCWPTNLVIHCIFSRWLTPWPVLCVLCSLHWWHLGLTVLMASGPLSSHSGTCCSHGTADVWVRWPVTALQQVPAFTCSGLRLVTYRLVPSYLQWYLTTPTFGIGCGVAQKDGRRFNKTG